MNTILMLAKFAVLFLFIVGFSYIISHSYPTISHQDEIHGFASIVSAQAETRSNNRIIDTEIVKLLLPVDCNK